MASSDQTRLLIVEDVPQDAQNIRGLLNAQAQIKQHDDNTEPAKALAHIQQQRPELELIDAQKQRREVKPHESEREYARIARLYPEQGYGFLETRARLNIYFHRDVVRDADFDDLRMGSEVLYTLAPRRRPDGADGEQRLDLGQRPRHPLNTRRAALRRRAAVVLPFIMASCSIRP